MREVDRRTKIDRRIFLQGAATAVPRSRSPPVPDSASKTPGPTGRHHADARDDEDSGEGGARHLSARSSRRPLLHHGGQAVGRQGGEDPTVKTLIETGVARLDQDAQDRHKCRYARWPWEADRVVLLQGIEQTAFFKQAALRSVRLALQQ